MTHRCLLAVDREERRIEEVVLNQLTEAAWGAMQTDRPPPIVLCHHVRARHQVLPELGGALRLWEPAQTEGNFMFCPPAYYQICWLIHTRQVPLQNMTTLNGAKSMIGPGHSTTICFQASQFLLATTLLPSGPGNTKEQPKINLSKMGSCKAVMKQR